LIFACDEVVRLPKRVARTPEGPSEEEVVEVGFGEPIAERRPNAAFCESGYEAEFGECPKRLIVGDELENLSDKSFSSRFFIIDGSASPVIKFNQSLKRFSLAGERALKTDGKARLAKKIFVILVR
jgi:hypothetical protein